MKRQHLYCLRTAAVPDQDIQAKATEDAPACRNIIKCLYSTWNYVVCRTLKNQNCSFAMDQVTLYSDSHELQKSDAAYVLQNYFRFVRWSVDEESTVLDVGCGDGDVTLHLLLPLLGKRSKKLIAADVSEEMIEFAKSRCQSSKVTFIKLDIGADNIPADYELNFDHIFSFYCLHWVQDQRLVVF